VLAKKPCRLENPLERSPTGAFCTEIPLCGVEGEYDSLRIDLRVEKRRRGRKRFVVSTCPEPLPPENPR